MKVFSSSMGNLVLVLLLIVLVAFPTFSFFLGDWRALLFLFLLNVVIAGAMLLSTFLMFSEKTLETTLVLIGLLIAIGCAFALESSTWARAFSQDKIAVILGLGDIIGILSLIMLVVLATNIILQSFRFKKSIFYYIKPIGAEMVITFLFLEGMTNFKVMYLLGGKLF